MANELKHIPFEFPVRGKVDVHARQAAPERTTIDLRNVLPFDRDGRARGASRFGYETLWDVSEIAAAPTVLTLVAAVYVFKDSLTLTFDKDIDISAIDELQFVIVDEVGVLSYDGAVSTATLLASNTVKFNLHITGAPSGSTGPLLTATASTGIIGASDASTWAGVTDLPLDYP